MEKPDPVWKLSMLSRAMLDFNIMLNAEGPAPFFRNLETMKDLHEEQKRLALKINIFYAVTFIGALLVLSGPLPTEAKISAFGIEAPLGALPQQVIAVMMAVAYSIFGTLFASFLILANMNGKILQAEGWEGWHFFGARFDASTLWATLITPRKIGYASPKRHLWIALAIFLVSSLAVIAHAFVVLTASIIALWIAIETGAWLLAVFGGIASLIVSVTIISVGLAIALPLPFRINEEESERGGG
jgi:hypothetical protein